MSANNGLTKSQTADLEAMLRRLNAAHRPAYFGAHERFRIVDMISAIDRRLNPTSPASLIAEAERILGPVEATLSEIDARPAVAP
jgi:hypothetical protein